MICYPHVKINLGLNVLRKRADGFHDLETLFIPYHGLHDVLEIISGDDYSRTSAALFEKYSAVGQQCPQLVQGVAQDGKVMITVARKEGVDWNPLEDLCVKAYQILDADFGLPSAKIFLEKLSPVGAGLGGGSSDAAFVIMMLNEMFSLSLDKMQMAEYASKLGSDCAFFIYDNPMFGEGRGDILVPFFPDGLDYESCPEGDFFRDERGKRYEIKIVVPEGIAVSTADAYRGIIPSVPATSLRQVLACPIETWKNELFNDFETTVFEKYPALKSLKISLYESGALYASMSGSGSSFFAIYED